MELSSELSSELCPGLCSMVGSGVGSGVNLRRLLFSLRSKALRREYLAQSIGAFGSNPGLAFGSGRLNKAECPFVLFEVPIPEPLLGVLLLDERLPPLNLDTFGIVTLIDCSSFELFKFLELKLEWFSPDSNSSGTSQIVEVTFLGLFRLSPNNPWCFGDALVSLVLVGLSSAAEVLVGFEPPLLVDRVEGIIYVTI